MKIQFGACDHFQALAETHLVKVLKHIRGKYTNSVKLWSKMDILVYQQFAVCNLHHTSIQFSKATLAGWAGIFFVESK